MILSTKRDVVVTIEDDIQQMQDGFLTTHEPNSGTPTNKLPLMWCQCSLDGANITAVHVHDGGSPPFELNVSSNDENTEAFLTACILDGDVRFESNRNLDHQEHC